MLVTAIEAEILERVAEALGYDASITPPIETVDGEDDYGEFTLVNPTPERLAVLVHGLKAEAKACAAAEFKEGETAALALAARIAPHVAPQ